jgi:hypothetical protein
MKKKERKEERRMATATEMTIVKLKTMRRMRKQENKRQEKRL